MATQLANLPAARVRSGGDAFHSFRIGPGTAKRGGGTPTLPSAAFAPLWAFLWHTEARCRHRPAGPGWPVHQHLPDTAGRAPRELPRPPVPTPGASGITFGCFVATAERRLFEWTVLAPPPLSTPLAELHPEAGPRNPRLLGRRHFWTDSTEEPCRARKLGTAVRA